MRKNLILGLKEFKNSFISKFKSNAESDEITFEGLAYHIVFNTNNIFHELHKILPKNIQEKLNYDLNLYCNSNKEEYRDIALYNYILKLGKIFEEKIYEFSKKIIKK